MLLKLQDATDRAGHSPQLWLLLQPGFILSHSKILVAQRVTEIVEYTFLWETWQVILTIAGIIYSYNLQYERHDQNTWTNSFCHCYWLPNIDLFLSPQGKTHTLKPSAKDHVLAMAKGPPAQPMEDISMRIYLCEGLLGTPCSLVSTSSYSFVKQLTFLTQGCPPSVYEGFICCAWSVTRLSCVALLTSSLLVDEKRLQIWKYTSAKCCDLSLSTTCASSHFCSHINVTKVNFNW